MLLGPQLLTAPASTTVVTTVAPARRAVSPVRGAPQWGSVSYTPVPAVQDPAAIVPVTTVAVRRSQSPRRGRSPERVQRELPATMHSLQAVPYSAPVVGRPSLEGSWAAPPAEVQTTEQQEKATDNEFMRLLDSLEVRVDLMAQMQHTRNKIQARAANVLVDKGSAEQGSVVMANGGSSCMPPVSRSLGGTAVFSAISPTAKQDGNEFFPAQQPWQQQWQQEPAGALQNMFDSLQPKASASSAEARLASENAELWQQLGEQRDCIGKLTKEVEGLQAQLQAVAELRQQQAAQGGENLEELHRQLQEALAREQEAGAEAQRLRQELLEEVQQRERETQEWRTEREQLRAELQQLLRAGTLAGGSSCASPTAASGNAVSALPTALVLPADAGVAAPQDGSGATAPFSQQTCGANVTLSEDGYTATRTRGCRQSVLLGSAPLMLQALGWYFELEVCETVEGWVGGLGIGVTRTSPGQLRRIPDKAWRLQHTFIVGYWGCVFLNGKERRTHWRADTLPVGARVGLLVSSDGSGDLRVFVDGTLVVSVPGALAEQVGPNTELFPVVDVFAATLKVVLQKHATPPPPPWGSVDGAYSPPPGSPSGSMVSVSRSMGGTRRISGSTDTTEHLQLQEN